MPRRFNFKIGRVEGGLGNFGQRYLITLDETSKNKVLTYQAHEIQCSIHEELPRYSDIVKKFKLEHVVGGGNLDFCPDDPGLIAVCGHAKHYGGVPHQIIEGFIPLLLDTYKKIDIRIIELMNFCHDVNLSDTWKNFY